MNRSAKSVTGSKVRTGITAGTASSNRHFSKQVVTAPTKEYLQMQLREFDFRNSSWLQVENKFRELHSLLSAPTSGLNAAQERIQQKEFVGAALVTFLDMCQAECRRLLAEGREKAAVEGGLATLNLKREYYGNNSLQLVAAFFHLARTNQCLGHIKRAEEFLSLAQLQIMRHPEADNSLKAELHQIYGLLYASDGRQDQALKHLTCAAYYLSCLNGPENILTSFCYFDLGNVFAALNHMENTMAFYEKVKDIWYAFLGVAIQRMVEVDRQVRAAEDEEIAAAIIANAEKIMGDYATSSVGAENVLDASKMLQAVVALQRDRFGVVHPVTARAELIYGMLLLWTGERNLAYDTLVRANEVSRRSSGERHEVTTETASLLSSFGMEVPADAALRVDELIRDTEQQKAASEIKAAGASSGISTSAIETAAAWQPSALAKREGDEQPEGQAAAAAVAGDPEVSHQQQPGEDSSAAPAGGAVPPENVADAAAADAVAPLGAATEQEGGVTAAVTSGGDQQQQSAGNETAPDDQNTVESHPTEAVTTDAQEVPEVETFDAKPLGDDSENPAGGDANPSSGGDDGEASAESERQPAQEGEEENIVREEATDDAANSSAAPPPETAATDEYPVGDEQQPASE